jgi:hypothetical protein
VSAYWTKAEAYVEQLDFEREPSKTDLARAIAGYAARSRAKYPQLYPGKPVHDAPPSWYVLRHPR